MRSYIQIAGKEKSKSKEDESNHTRAGTEPAEGDQKSDQKPEMVSKTYRLKKTVAEEITRQAQAFGITNGTLLEQIINTASTQYISDQVPGEKEAIDDFTSCVNHAVKAYTDLVSRYGSLKSHLREEFQRRLDADAEEICDLKKKLENACEVADLVRKNEEVYLSRMQNAVSDARRCQKEADDTRVMMQETSRMNAMLEGQLEEARQKLKDFDALTVRAADLGRTIDDLKHSLETQKTAYDHSLELQRKDAAFEKAESLRALERELTEAWRDRCEELSNQNAALQARLMILEQRLTEYENASSAPSEDADLMDVEDTKDMDGLEDMEAADPEDSVDPEKAEEEDTMA